MNDFYVYAYLRSEDSDNGLKGSPYYIGKGVSTRAFRLNHNVPVPKTKANIVFLGTDMAEVDAFQAEMLLIHLYGRIDLGTGCLHNSTDGGEGPTGAVRSEEQREATRKQCLGRPVSEQAAQKIRASLTGRKRPTFSEEWKQNLSSAQRESESHWSRSSTSEEVITAILLKQQSDDAQERSRAARAKPRPAISAATRLKMKAAHANQARVGGQYVQ